GARGRGPGGTRGRGGSVAGPRGRGAKARRPSGGHGAPRTGGRPLAARLARARPHADRSRRRPDRTGGPPACEDASPGSRLVGPERHAGGCRDPDQPRDCLEPRRRRADRPGSVERIARLENPYSPATRYEEIARLYETQGRGSDAAPWRARADDLFARLQAGGDKRTVGG